MILSEQEKRELLEDGRSTARQKVFREIKQGSHKSSRLLNDYIQYLMSIQKIFGEFPLSRKSTLTRFNKL